MSDQFSQESEAIKKVLEALSPLSTEVASHVLRYINERLGLMPMQQRHQTDTDKPADRPEDSAKPPKVDPTPKHIKEFVAQKKPRSANEMAALVAYFLSEIVPGSEKKQSIGIEDIKTYFKIAEFKLPTQMRMTLTNAKNAGYLDLAGDGQYRLNAVGHNLVVHSMPRNGGKRSARKSKKSSKRIKKRVKSHKKHS